MRPVGLPQRSGRGMEGCEHPEPVGLVSTARQGERLPGVHWAARGAEPWSALVQVYCFPWAIGAGYGGVGI